MNDLLTILRGKLNMLFVFEVIACFIKADISKWIKNI